ncbi:MAG TPA: sorbosone dehydrogenase family protein, partial [Pyrinomonadaceae bacterium]|nr:sorbosone dehydrogenase family protein [Pyrinomonadaceae bacterium]
MNSLFFKNLWFVFLIFSFSVVNAVSQNQKPAGQTKETAQKTESKSNLPKIEHFNKAPVTQIKPENMPSPFATESARRPSRQVPQPADAVLKIPKGFKINVFAEGGFTYPRWMALAPNGDVFVADSRANSIVVLRDKNKDGVADERFTFAENLAQPFGMAFWNNWFYVANTDSVVRFNYKPGQTKAEGTPEKIIELTRGGYNQHWTRNLIFSPDGTKLYVSIGSETNAEIESDPRRAAISVYNPDGTNHRIFASGLRNPIGLDFNPATGELWTAVNERDGLGDDLVPDYVTSVKEGGFYGFPQVYIGKNVDPRRKNDVKPEHLEKVIVPDVLVTSHSAALGIVFYDGKMFPKEYQGDAFVALHGSWNREKLTGYKIIRVPFEKGKLVGN